MKGVKGRILKKLKLVTFQLNHPQSLYKHPDCCKNSLSTLSPSIVLDFKDQSESETETFPDQAKLTDFEEKCPPGGEDSVIFYTTSLGSIRKTYEDCRSVKFLLDSFKVMVQERDVSMDIGLKEEMWGVLGERVVPPRVFIEGRYIGGAEEVVSLHEQGKLKRLLQGIPLSQQSGICIGCGNVRFVICSICHGSSKVYADGDDGLFVRCTNCNENGLVKCSVCC